MRTRLYTWLLIFLALWLPVYTGSAMAMSMCDPSHGVPLEQPIVDHAVPAIDHEHHPMDHHGHHGGPDSGSPASNDGATRASMADCDQCDVFCHTACSPWLTASALGIAPAEPGRGFPAPAAAFFSWIPALPERPPLAA